MMSMIALYENNKGSYYGLMYEDGYIFQIMYVSLFIVEVMLYSKYIDYYLKKQCALILIRYQSRRKVLTIVLEKLCIRITIVKVIEVTIYYYKFIKGYKSKLYKCCFKFIMGWRSNNNHMPNTIIY